MFLYQLIKKINFLIIFSLLILFFLLPKQSQAVSLAVLPEKFDLVLEQGENFSDKIRIANLGQETLFLKIHLSDFRADDQTGAMIFEGLGDVTFSPSQWIFFQENEFNLQPGEFKEVGFSIRVPQNAEPGGYYTSSFFEINTLEESKQSNVKISSWAGALFLLSVKGDLKFPSLDKQIEMVNLEAPSFIEVGPFKASFLIKNNDPVHVRVGGKAIIYNPFKKIKEEIKIEQQTILPQSVRRFELQTADKELIDKIFIGPYNLEISLASQTWQDKIGSNGQLVRSLGFWGFPWKVFLILIVIILIILLLILIFKKKKKKPSNNQLPITKNNELA